MWLAMVQSHCHHTLTLMGCVALFTRSSAPDWSSEKETVGDESDGLLDAMSSVRGGGGGNRMPIDNTTTGLKWPRACLPVPHSLPL